MGGGGMCGISDFIFQNCFLQSLAIDTTHNWILLVLPYFPVSNIKLSFCDGVESGEKVAKQMQKQEKQAMEAT